MNNIIKMLNDEEFLRNIRTLIVTVLFLLIPFIYLMTAANYTIQAAGSVFAEFSGLGLVGFIDKKIALLEIKKRAFEDECVYNVELSNTNKNILEEQNKVEIDNAICVISQTNKKQQSDSNNTLTNEKISKLERKINKCKIKGKTNSKSYKKFKAEKETLQNFPKFNKSFEPLEVSDILYSDKVKSKKNNLGGKSSVVYNPKKGSVVIQIITAPLSFFGFGSTLLATFAIGISGVALVIFLTTLILWTSVQGVMLYIIVRKKTGTTYLQTQQNKLKLLRKINDNIQTPVLDVNEVNKTMEDTKDEN